MTFEEWMEAVDMVVENITMGLSVDDLPDIAFRDLYDSGALAQEAAEEVLVYAEFPLDELGYL